LISPMIAPRWFRLSVPAAGFKMQQRPGRHTGFHRSCAAEHVFGAPRIIATLGDNINQGGIDAEW
jgi:hypothetical protein